MQVCTSLQTDNHAGTPPLSFLQAGCPSCCPTNSVKALKVVALKVVPTSSYVHNFVFVDRQAGYLQLLEILEISWNLKFLLEISGNLVDAPGNFLIISVIFAHQKAIFTILAALPLDTRPCISRYALGPGFICRKVTTSAMLTQCSFCLLQRLSAAGPSLGSELAGTLLCGL